MLHQEWLLLQQQYEDYEKQSLQIKLFSVFIAALGLAVGEPLYAGLVVVLWVADMMVKTMQHRLTPRLLALEQALANGASISPAQLHGPWLQQRSGLAGLLREYSQQAIKPTVAIIPLLLVVVMAVACWETF